MTRCGLEILYKPAVRFSTDSIAGSELVGLSR
jgi:hypothetical protein